MPFQPQKSVSSPTRSFRRELTLLDSTMLVIGTMIGSGIFIVSADMARTVGSSGHLLLVWLITGLITVIGALSYGELAAMMPSVGGPYVYLREAYNPLMGFLYGWTLFLVIQCGSIAAVAVAFAKFTGVLLPWFGEDRILFSIFGLHVSAAQILAIGVIVLLTGINIRGVRQGKLVQDVFGLTKTAALLALILLGIFIGRNSEAVSANLSRFWDGSWTKIADGKIVGIQSLSGLTLLAAIGAASVGSLFATDAWYNITYTADEVVRPKRTIPLSLVLGTVIVTVLYMAANAAYILVLPVAGSPDGATEFTRGIQFAASDRVGTAAASAMIGRTGAVLMAVMIMISTFGCNNGMILAGARVYYAMAKDGLFFRKIGVLNKNGVPGFALGIQAVWASLLCLSGTYSNLLDYVIFAVLLFFILTIAGLFLLRKKRPDAERPYRAFGYPVVPLLYIVVASAIAADLLIVKQEYTWHGLIIVLTGIPAYFLWKRFGRKPTEG
jgi:APA family basic amino acid/polyamine antiporter